MDFCSVPFATLDRFVLVVGIGSLCAVTSVFENIFLFYTLVTNKKYRQSSFLYFIFLASCDTFVSLSYLFLIAVDNIKDFTRSVWLANVWWSYFIYMFTTCHVAMTSSTFLLVAATFERFLVQFKSGLLAYVERYRVFVASGAVMMGCVMKAPILFEIHLVENENCTGISRYVPDVTPMCKNFFYGTVYKFYVRNIATVFVPFIFLSFFNARIVFSVRRWGHRAALFRFTTTQQAQSQVRMATRMLMVVVFTYLLSNTLNVILTAWEHIDMESLLFDHVEFYMYTADIVSVLAVLGCFSRLPIFVIFNRDIREAVLYVLVGCCPWSKKLFAAERFKRKTSKKVNRRCSQFDKLAMSIALHAQAIEKDQESAPINGYCEVLHHFEKTDTIETV